MAEAHSLHGWKLKEGESKNKGPTIPFKGTSSMI
jgi:hypothetical protein